MKEQPRPKRSNVELLLDFLQARLGTIILVAGLGTAGALYLGIDPDIPREAKLIAITAIAFAPLGWFAGNYITSLLWSPNIVYLLDLDARTIDGGLYAFPADDFRELEVQHGSLTELTPNLYSGKNVDLDEMTAHGTWRGTLSDRELCRALNRVDECRSQLEDDAKRGFAIETQAWTIIRSATRQATKRVVQTFEEGTLPDEGEAIGHHIDRALEQYDLEDELHDRVDEDFSTDVSEFVEDERVDNGESATTSELDQKETKLTEAGDD